jgi:hypothetical protein
MRVIPALKTISVSILTLLFFTSGPLSSQTSVWVRDASYAPSFPINLTLTGANYDAAVDRHVVVQASSISPLTDMQAFAYDAVTETWTALNATLSPPARHSFNFAFDPLRGKHVLFGGIPALAGDSLKVWELEVGVGWSQVTTTDTPGLGIRAAMAFDEGLGQMVLTGGLAGAGTWAFDGSDWSMLTANRPANGTEQLTDAAMAYDPVRGVLVYFGGQRGTLPSNETWEFAAATGTWTRVLTPGSPPLCDHASLAYDAARGVMVAQVESASLIPGGLVVSTWLYDGATWTPEIVPGTTPTTRGAFSFDDAGGVGLYVLPRDFASPASVLPNATLYRAGRAAAYPGSTSDAAIALFGAEGFLSGPTGVFTASRGGTVLPDLLGISAFSPNDSLVAAPAALLATVQASGTPRIGRSLLGGGAPDIWIDPGNVFVLANGLNGGAPQIGPGSPAIGPYVIDPVFVGFDIVFQLIVAAPGANPLGLVSSAAAVVTIQ